MIRSYSYVKWMHVSECECVCFTSFSEYRMWYLCGAATDPGFSPFPYVRYVLLRVVDCRSHVRYDNSVEIASAPLRTSLAQTHMSKWALFMQSIMLHWAKVQYELYNVSFISFRFSWNANFITTHAIRKFSSNLSFFFSAFTLKSRFISFFFSFSFPFCLLHHNLCIEMCLNTCVYWHMYNNHPSSSSLSASLGSTSDCDMHRMDEREMERWGDTIYLFMACILNCSSMLYLSIGMCVCVWMCFYCFIPATKNNFTYLIRIFYLQSTTTTLLVVVVVIVVDVGRRHHSHREIRTSLNLNESLRAIDINNNNNEWKKCDGLGLAS